ncbi:MAG: serine hydrolase [Spirochaetaceae bacterium]|nr:serine hydrolase [Spirochaetaceae bacterium]
MRGLRGRAIALVLLAGLVAAAPGRAFMPLWDATEPTLQVELEKTLRRLGLSRLIAEEKLSVTLVGISDADCPRVAGVNENVMMYAASMPKLAILLAAFKRIERGEMVLDDELSDLMTRMIRYSSNSAATEVMDRVGREFIAQVLTSPELKLYDREHGGGLWVGRAYAKRAAWRRDPLHNLSHGATTMQVARLYYLLEEDRLLEPSLAERMREMLSEPGVNHKFVAGLHARYPGALMWRKSGTWRDYHSDSAIIEHDGRRYIAVAMVQSPKGEEILRRLIVDLDALIFRVPARCPDPDGRYRSVPARSAP